MIEALGIYGYIWLYALFSIMACVFTLLCIPETKGKRLDEITSAL